MSEKQLLNTEKKSSLKLPGATDGLLFGDDPRLLRLVKYRIKKRYDKNKPGMFPGLKNFVNNPYFVSDQYENLDAKTLGFLTQEAALERIDFSLDIEKIRAPIFEKILANIAHLDFRNFKDQWNYEFTIYDPEVITPHVSWAIEQIFSNLPGFFIKLAELTKQNADFASKQIDIIRNVFILGYAHGFLNQNVQDYEKIKELLAYAIQQSEASPDGLKPYPAFLANLVELDDLKQTSPRLRQLKKHWTEQFARRWMTLIRTDDASKKSLSPATQHAAGIGLSRDTRPADSFGQAKKMDLQRKQRNALSGRLSPHETVTAEQVRTEGRLELEAAQIRQSATADMRGILRLYQGSDRENFHNNQQTSEKWRPFKMAAEQILGQLVIGYSTMSQASEGRGFDSAGHEIFTRMITTLGAIAGDKTVDMKALFGNDFFSLAKIEQLCLISFAALTFVERETPTIQRAIYVLDSLLVPKLNAHTDLDQTNNLFPANTPPLSFTAFDFDTQKVKAHRAQQALETLRPEDGLMSVENQDFTKMLAAKKTALLSISKVLNFFARTTDEKDWLKNATFNSGALTTLLVLVGTVSGYFNFNFTQDLLERSIQTMLKADPSTWHYLTRAGQFGIGFGVLGTIATFAGAIGQQARESAKKLSLTTSDSDKQARESLKWKRHQTFLTLLLLLYGASSLAPLAEKGAREVWDNIQQWREELKAAAEEQDPDAPKPFWQERNPEARDPELLEKVEKTIWGEIIIGEDVYGKTKNSPIGFINTYNVEPRWSEGAGWPELHTSPMTIDLEKTQVINALHWRQDGDRIIFTLANGEEFVQEAAGTDFVIKNGLTNNKEGFVRFLDENRVIDRVIIVPKNVARHVIFTNDEVFLPGLDEQRMLWAIDGSGYEFFVVYKTEEWTGEQEPLVTNLAEQKNHWEITQDQREKILMVLEQENPEAAALYQRMVAEHEAFFSDINFEQNLYNYRLMLKRQADEYQAFVQSRHVYSLKYNPKTNYAQKDHEVGVLLDVMSLKEGGYYCLTAHLAAQQWFLSLGVTTDGLHGFSLYNDNGKAGTRIAHVKTSLYGMIYDFTPTRPNPGEDLSSLSYNPEDPVGSQGNPESFVLDEKAQAILELFQQLATAENLALALAGLTLAGATYFGLTGIDLLLKSFANRNQKKNQQIKEALPKNQTELQSLTYSLLHLVNLLTGLQRDSQESELTAAQRSEKLAQVVKETLVLAATPINRRGQAASLAQINPEVFALFNAAGINADAKKTGDASDDAATALNLWEKIGQNPAELKANLEEILKLTDSTSAEFQTGYEKKKRTLAGEIRALQRQLYRARKKENTIYGRFGLLLEGFNLMSGEGLREQRLDTTSAIFTISQELERRQFALDALNQQMQLLPKNARHLRKVLVFLLKQMAENRTLENDKT